MQDIAVDALNFANAVGERDENLDNNLEDNATQKRENEEGQFPHLSSREEANCADKDEIDFRAKGEAIWDSYNKAPLYSLHVAMAVLVEDLLELWKEVPCFDGHPGVRSKDYIHYLE